MPRGLVAGRYPHGLGRDSLRLLTAIKVVGEEGTDTGPRNFSGVARDAKQRVIIVEPDITPAAMVTTFLTDGVMTHLARLVPGCFEYVPSSINDGVISGSNQALVRLNHVTSYYN